jgi:hypothetical protein
MNLKSNQIGPILFLQSAAIPSLSEVDGRTKLPDFGR